MSDTMELAVIDAQSAVQIFTTGGMKPLLDSIEAKVRAIPLDPSTASGREEIRSVAYKVARTKTALDAEGKKLTEGWREATKKVNEERKLAVERLDALGEEVRKPLTDFENKEKLRVLAHEEALKDITGLHAMIVGYPDMPSELLEDHLRDLEKSNPDRNWEEFTHRAQVARAEAHRYITKRIEDRRKYEAEQAELARLRKEEAERLQRERDERLKAEAAEKARLEEQRKSKEAADAEAKRVIEAAQAEQERVKAEAERVRRETERLRLEAEAKAKAEQDRLKAEARAIEEKRQAEEKSRIAAEQRAKDAEVARIASEKKAEEDRKKAAEKASSDLKAAKEKARKDAEAAAAKERERIESERKEKEAEEAKRAADKANRERIHREIANDCAEKSANEIATAIMSGKVRHVKVIF